MSDTLLWWAVDAGVPGEREGVRGEGERDGRVRASDETRARELYLSQRPASWVIFSIAPSSAPATLPRDERFGRPLTVPTS